MTVKKREVRDRRGELSKEEMGVESEIRERDEQEKARERERDHITSDLVSCIVSLLVAAYVTSICIRVRLGAFTGVFLWFGAETFMQQGLAPSYAFVRFLRVTDWGLGFHIRSLQLSV